MTTTLPVVYDAGEFQLSSFRDRDGNPLQIRETEARIARILDGLRAVDTVRVVSAVSAFAQAEAVFAELHAPGYREFLRTASVGAAEVLDPRYAAPGVAQDTPVTPGAYMAAVRAGASAVRAATAILDGDRASYAVCRPPGHHAGRAFMGGYCYLNNACAAAWTLRAAGRRVAVIDVDFHHGNGTADVLASEPDVPFVCLHASTLTQFPYQPITPLAPHHVFVSFDGVPTAAEYLSALHTCLATVGDADVLVVSLGYDLVHGDPHGGWAMPPAFFTDLARTFRNTGCQLCIVQEGGYALDVLAACAHAFARGLT